ncbi:MAG: type secretion system protein [Pseudomonadota bacterium]|jgi:general secretion pathway protein D
MKKTILFIAICASLATLSGVFAQEAAPVGRKGEAITLNFNNADIESVARTIATLTGRNVVVDPRVKGTMSLVTEKPISPALAYNQFLAMLRLQGFTVVESAGLDKIVPEADAKLQGGAVLDGIPANPKNSQIMTQIFKLNFENANNLVPILRPLISPNNTINVNPSNNSLVITDYGDNLRRMAQIIAAMDVSNATDIEIIVLQHAIASDLVPLVQRLLDSSSSGAAVNPTGGAGDASFKTTVIAEPRSNTVVIRAANPARLALAKSLITKLDQPSSKNPTGNIYVVYLKNAEATKLAATLRAALASGGSSTPSSAQVGTLNATAPPTSNNTATPQSSTGGSIQADAATNSLIITAPEPQYRQIRAVIDQLDQRRAQVYVESLIAEVNTDKADEFGVQWQSALGQNGDTNVGFLGTNFKIGGTNIVDLAVRAATGAGAALPSNGINLGIAHQTNGVYVLGALARFIQSNGAGNVLSTPNLVTLDNEEAKIVIGKNVPFVTGQFTNTGSTSTGTVNPFQTYERKDVGLTLRVKPQISENGTVKLTVFQEVSSIDPASVNSASGPITNKRSIETNVLVNDGSIVVLGGLLTDEVANNQEKVPGLGDLPWIGNLFKSETRSRKKTNLMLFLRPVVMRDAAATDSLSQSRYDQMRSLQQSDTLPSSPSPVLP